MLEIFNGEKSYYNEYESFCSQNCIRIILEHYGLNYAPLYINSALSFILRRDDLHICSYDISYNNNARDVLPTYSKNVTRYNYKEGESGNKIYELNKQKIKSGIPIITGVDIYYLPYLQYFKKTHGSHSLIMCGLLENDNLLNVIDWYQPWFFKGVIDKNNFIAARTSENLWDGSIYSGKPINNHWTEIDSMGWDGTAIELLYQTIDLTIKQYYMNLFVKDKNTFQGIYAIKQLYDIIAENKQKTHEQKSVFLNDLYNKLYAALKRHKLFKLYIELSTQWIRGINVNLIIKQLKEITSKWDMTLILILKASMSKSDNNYDRVLNSMAEVICYEEKLFDSLYSIKNELEK